MIEPKAIRAMYEAIYEPTPATEGAINLKGTVEALNTVAGLLGITVSDVSKALLETMKVPEKLVQKQAKSAPFATGEMKGAIYGKDGKFIGEAVKVEGKVEYAPVEIPEISKFQAIANGWNLKVSSNVIEDPQQASYHWNGEAVEFKAEHSDLPF
jgi:hypothetical protein